MSNPFLDFNQAPLSGQVSTSFGEPVPAASAQKLRDYQYVVLRGEERLEGLRTAGRMNCMGVDMTDGEVEFGAHFLPGDGWDAALLLHNIFGQRLGQKFGIVVSGTGRERQDTGESAGDMVELLKAMSLLAGGRTPDVIVFPRDVTTLPPDYNGAPEEYGQLVHKIRLEQGVEIHTYAVPGTDYFREGTLEQLAHSQPVYLVAA